MRKPLTVSALERMLKTLAAIRRRQTMAVGSLVAGNFILAVFIFLGPAAKPLSTEAVVLLNSSTVLGTAFFVNSEGYLLTAASLVKSDTLVQLYFRDGTTTEARVLFVDRERDIALLQSAANSKIPEPLPLGEPSAIARGDQVYVIGYPSGSSSQTSGTVTNPMREYLQTDLAADPGNLGGPLLSKATNTVIGVVVAKSQLAGQRNGGQHHALTIEAVEALCREKQYELR